MRTINNIKEAIGGAMIVLYLVLMLGLVGYNETHYTRTGVVFKVEDDNVIIEDTTGNLWGIDGDGYEVGQAVSMKMHTRGTDSIITDDEVVDVKIINTNNNNND